MSTVHNLAVTMEDGSAWEVQGDQRDIARFEAEPFGVPFYELQTRPFLYIRYVAWNAGRRSKLHTLSWEQFCDQAVEVRDMDQQVGEEAPEADPGNPAPSAGN